MKGVAGEEECFFFRGSEMFTFKKVLVNYVIICFYYLIGIIDFLKVLEMDISRLLKSVRLDHQEFQICMCIDTCHHESDIVVFF